MTEHADKKKLYV